MNILDWLWGGRRSRGSLDAELDLSALSSCLQETMMDHPLRTISYIADIGNIVVLMARRRMPRSNSQENVEASHPSQDGKRQYKMICHVFESEDVRVASFDLLLG